MKNAVTYARVSSKEQEQGFSLESQVGTASTYAGAKQFDVVKVFAHSESAKKQGRKHFNSMLDYLREHRDVKVVLVEKTDRLCRNLHDFVMIESLVEELGLEIHLIKEGQILQRNAKSQDRLVQGLFALLARNFIQNQQEEIQKGLLLKAQKGHYPGRAPFGYAHDRETRTIVQHSTRADVVQLMFQLQATGSHSLKTLRKAIIAKTGERVSKSHLAKILRSRFYTGSFTWRGAEYAGKHPRLVDLATFNRVQQILSGRNKAKPRRHDFPFSGLLSCAHDQCAITAEKHKGKYVYYRCSFGRGRHAFPYMREERVAELLGEVLESIRIPFDIASAITSASQGDKEIIREASRLREAKLRQRLSTLQTKREKAFDDKHDGVIDEEFWRSRDNAWRLEQEQIKITLAELPSHINSSADLSKDRILELATRARELYSQRPDIEKADLLKSVVINCGTDGGRVFPQYREPFGFIMSGSHQLLSA